ncbi:TetR/AcrR family transcriptional regulator [Pseudomonas promysalinigenes]|uniref:TetR/AcrR family transcriptional regulator n=1 Tax=Pseudomonas promysalinigenes TaxID=485898 RepID=UPI0039171B1C
MKRAGRPRKQGAGVSEKWVAIVDAALEIALNEGVQQVTFRKVAQRANVSPGTITYYFEGLEQVIIQALVKGAGSLFEFLDLTVLGAWGPEKVKHYLATVVSGCGDKALKTPQRSRVDAYVFILGRPELHPALTAFRAQAVQSLAIHFDRDRATAMFAYVEGAVVHGRLTGIEVLEHNALMFLTALASTGGSDALSVAP